MPATRHGGKTIVALSLDKGFGHPVPIADIDAEEKRPPLERADVRALALLTVTGAIVSGLWWVNATVVFDDVGFPPAFSGLVQRRGWFGALITIFCLDFPTEYRSYGLSRVIQFLLWSVGAASATAYAAIITLSQLATALVLYRLLTVLRSDRIAALAVGLLWLLSPLLATSCFHHYSYLILPAQIMIVGSYVLVTVTDDGRRSILAVGLGAALGLTGELHFLAVPLVLILVARASDGRLPRRTALVAITSMVVTVAAHYAVWKIFVADPTRRARFAPTWGPDVAYWQHRIFVAVRSVVRSLIEQLDELAGPDVVGLAIVAVATGALVFAGLTWASRAGGQATRDETPERSPLKLAVVLLAVSCAYLAVFVTVVVFADAVPQTMPRRYGFVPLTLALAVGCLVVAAAARGRIETIAMYSVVLGLVGALFLRHQAIVLPAARATDSRLSDEIGKALKPGPGKGVLFFWASDKEFPRVVMDGRDRGPAMRRATSAELAQAKYGTAWPTAIDAIWTLRAPYACAIERVRADGKLGVVCPPWMMKPEAPDGSQAVIVANLGFEEYDPAGRHARVFPDYGAFAPYFFAKKLVREPFRVAGSPVDEFTIDLGRVDAVPAAALGSMRDKKFADVLEPNKDWVENYGLISGQDQVYTNLGLGSALAYYRTNRHGAFTYGVVLRAPTTVEVSLDVWEQWGHRPGGRPFELDVSWDGTSWASVGTIDPALVNGPRPFSVVLTRRDAKLIQLRFKPAAGAKDVPVAQGLRIRRLT